MNRARSMDWLRRLGESRLLDVGVIGIAFLCAVRIAVMLPGRAIQNDFAHNYVSSRLLLEGANPYTTAFAPVYKRFGFVYEEDIPSACYPPAMQWVFAPLALLPVDGAFWCWVGCQTICLGVILWLTRRLLATRLSPRGWWFVCAAAVCSAAVYWHYYFSQVQLFLAAIVLAAYALHREGKPAAACLAVTVAGLVKVFPLVLLPWFVWRGGENWRTRTRLAALSVVFAGTMVVVTGLDRWIDFYQRSIPLLTAVALNHSFNFTLPALVINLGWASHGFAPEPGLAGLWVRAGVVVGLVMLALAYLPSLRARCETALEAEFCLLTVAMLAASLKAVGHYFVFLIFPMACAAARLAVRPTGMRIVAFSLLLVLLNDLGTRDNAWLQRHLYVKILANDMPLFGLLALGFIFWKELTRNRRPAQPFASRDRKEKSAAP